MNIKKLALLMVLPLVASLLVFDGGQKATADDLFATQYDGVDDYAIAQNVTGGNLGNSAGTFYLWVKRNGTADLGAQAYHNLLMLKTSTGTTRNKVAIGLTLDGKAKIYRFVYGDIDHQSMSGTAVITDNQWHFLALTSNGLGTLKLYVDGNLDLTWSPGTWSMTNFQVLVLTSYYDGGTLGGAFTQGLIDQAAIWSTERTQAQIQADMCTYLSGIELNLVAYWPMDEGSGTTTSDATGGGQTLTLVNGVVWSQDTGCLPIGEADLSITKTDSPDPVTVGSNLTYTITATNDGPDVATGVMVTDTLPADVTFISSSSSQGTCSGTTTITCTLGSLANSATATMTIVVTPTAVGTLSNTASVAGSETDSNTANNTATAVTTVTSTPTLLVSPTSLDFGSVTVNSTKDLTFTVINSGGGTLTGSVTASSPFSIVSGSPFSLTAGAGQTVTVRFSPTTPGTFISLATVSSNVGSATVALSGTGTPSPALSVSATSLDFGSVTVGSTKDLTFTVTNSGGGTLTGSVTASSPFSIVSGGSFSLTAGASQTVTVRFSPTTTDAFTGTATVSSNGGSATVSLSGTGVEEQVPLLLVTPTSLAFGSVTVGSSSDLSFTVTNVGGGTLTGTATTNPPYSVVSGSSFSLSAGATRTVTVRFSPTSTGGFADIVSVSSNGGNAVVTLSGTGTEVSNPLLSVSPTSLNFGEVAVGSSKDLTFTVSNAGTGTLTGTVTASSPFSVTAGSSFSLGTGASQVVTVRFSPTVERFVSSTAAVNSNGGNVSVTLMGTGVTTQNPLLSVTPTSLDFGSVQVGSSKDLTFFVQNSGGGTLTGTVSTSAPGFSIVSGSSFTLTAGATQTVTVRFSPTEGGTFSGTVTVSSNGGGASVTVTGVGESVSQPILTVTPTILNFGFMRVGTKDLSFTVQNTGEGTLAGTATATDPFSVVTNSSFTVDAGDLVLVTVRFSPPTKGPFTGTVKFSSNGGNMTAAVVGRGWQLPFGLSEGEVVVVEIDIHPAGGAVGIDCQEPGVIVVRIFDVRELPWSIVMETLSLEGGGPPQSWATADVDGDGAEDDLVVHFGIEGVRDEVCQKGVSLFTLRGELEDRTPIEGSNKVNIVRGR